MHDGNADTFALCMICRMDEVPTVKQVGNSREGPSKITLIIVLS